MSKNILAASNTHLHAIYLDTPLGSMLAIADEHGLYALEFSEQRALTTTAHRLAKKHNTTILPAENPILRRIHTELNNYFAGNSLSFTTPIHLTGTAFQNNVWQQLMMIQPGHTRSYADIAKTLNKPTAFRAVAQANGANLLPIIIPCHRVIYADGTLGGYSSGTKKKEWLLAHEKKFSTAPAEQPTIHKTSSTTPAAL